MRTAHATIGVCTATLIAASQGRADSVYTYIHRADGTRAVFMSGPNPWQPRTGFHAYDNWRTSTDGGISRLRGRFTTGSDELGDDLHLVTTGTSLLSDIGFSIWNGSMTGVLTSYRTTLRFFDSERHQLGQDSYVWDISISPQEGIALYSGGGFYRPFGIVLPTQIFMSIQFSEIQGIAPEDIGVTLSGPRTTGYSSAFAQNFTTGQQVNFDGTDQTNIKFFVDTVDAPGPGTPLAAGAAILLTTRRRR